MERNRPAGHRHRGRPARRQHHAADLPQAVRRVQRRRAGDAHARTPARGGRLAPTNRRLLWRERPRRAADDLADARYRHLRRPLCRARVARLGAVGGAAHLADRAVRGTMARWRRHRRRRVRGADCVALVVAVGGDRLERRRAPRRRPDPLHRPDARRRRHCRRAHRSAGCLLGGGARDAGRRHPGGSARLRRRSACHRAASHPGQRDGGRADAWRQRAAVCDAQRARRPDAQPTDGAHDRALRRLVATDHRRRHRQRDRRRPRRLAHLCQGMGRVGAAGAALGVRLQPPQRHHARDRAAGAARLRPAQRLI